MDGDLGQYDVLGPRLVAADTVLVLDFSLVRCIWRAARRSRERADFWWWVLWWRYRSRPALLQAVATYAPTADLRIVRNPRALQRLWVQIEAARPGGRHRGRFAQHSGTRTLPDPPHGPTPGLNECRPGTLSATEADGPHRQRHECAFIG